MKTYRKQKIKIRFANLSSKIVSSLKQDFAKSKITTNEQLTKNKNRVVVVLDLDDSFDCNGLCRFIAKHEIPRKNIMLWVSLVTEQYTDGVLVPKYVLHLLSRLGCGLNFSFTRV